MIVPMKYMTLVALKEDEERILKALQKLAAVQLLEAAAAPAEVPQLSDAETRVQKLSGALALLKPYAAKRGMLTPKPEETLEAITSAVSPALEVSERIEATDRKKSAVRAQIDRCAQERESLLPWAELHTPMQEVAGTRSTAVLAGFLPAEAVEKLKELTQIAYELYGGEVNRAVIVACPRETERETLSALKDMGFTEFSFPKRDGTPQRAMETLSQMIAEREQEAAALEQALAEMGAERDCIAAAADAAVIERDREQAKTAFLNTEKAFMLTGWVRADREEDVRRAVSEITDAYVIKTREPTEDEVPPSVVQNSKLISPYEGVTNLYSRPDPRGVDGTPLMTPFYFIFFGMMLADLGYGLLLLLGCWFFIKRMKPTGMMGELAAVLFMGAISTIIWAPLIGTVFGEDLDLLFGTTGLFPLVIDPMEEPMNMLILCLVMGYIQIFFGICIKIKMSFAAGDWQTAVFDNICWLLVLVGLPLMLVLPAYSMIGIVLAVVGALGILLMKGRGKKNPLKRLTSGLGELYNVTSFLSDILSYARLFALGIATGVIGSVYNMLGQMLMGSPNVVLRILGTIIGIALLCGLHVFNLAINTLGTFIHCSRLQFIEFYGKFYEPGGKPFRPLGYAPRHVRLTD